MIRIAVLRGHGINCDRETAALLNDVMDEERVDGGAERVHVNRLLRGERDLVDYQMLVVPGGFLHGDDIGAGTILANTLKTRLDGDIRQFVNDGKLVLGICNGFQVLAKYPLLPRPSTGQQSVSLTWNETGRFQNRWTHLAVEDSQCIYLDGIDRLHLPIRHGEGKFVTDADTLATLEQENHVALRYAAPDGTPAGGAFPANPNGSMNDIAGICDDTGRVFGLMPHPEAFHTGYNHPHWAIRKKRDGETPAGLGRGVFANAVTYLAEHF